MPLHHSHKSDTCLPSPWAPVAADFSPASLASVQQECLEESQRGNHHVSPETTPWEGIRNKTRFEATDLRTETNLTITNGCTAVTEAQTKWPPRHSPLSPKPQCLEQHARRALHKQTTRTSEQTTSLKCRGAGGNVEGLRTFAATVYAVAPVNPMVS